jgi:alkaline phosphatase D
MLRGLAEGGLHPTRREFLAYIGALLAVSACGDGDGGGDNGAAPPAPTLSSNPFTLGVASGDPLSESVVLWTRLAIDPLDTSAMPNQDIPVIWELASDADFRRIVRSGWRFAPVAFAHSLHVDVGGLTPDTWYFYRLRVGDQWMSPTGRTRTLPAPAASPERFRIALASCQSYQDGYFPALGFLAREEIDLVAFVGDYIYEYGGKGSVRDHDGPTLQTLAQFRNRYALYKSDANLQAAHHRCPWIMTWDDHEVSNNYAGLALDAGAPPVDGRALRAAAYQAYYEHMPIRIPRPADFADMQIYHSFAIGDLATVYVLDGRQYRTDQACNDAPQRPCAEVFDPDRTMLGAPQKQWLVASLRTSSAVWNVIAQQVIFAPLNFGGRFVIPDLWDGYPIERQALLDVFGETRNVIMLTGDFHAAGFATLHADPLDLTSAVVGHEAICTSISSGGDTGELGIFADRIREAHSHLHYFNDIRRGYTVCDFDRERVRFEFRAVSTVLQPSAELFTDAAFEVEAGSGASRRVDV